MADAGSVERSSGLKDDLSNLLYEAEGLFLVGGRIRAKMGPSHFAEWERFRHYLAYAVAEVRQMYLKAGDDEITVD